MATLKHNPALDALRHYVTGAIERGEAEAVEEMPARSCPLCMSERVEWLGTLGPFNWWRCHSCGATFKR